MFVRSIVLAGMVSLAVVPPTIAQTTITSLGEEIGKTRAISDQAMAAARANAQRMDEVARMVEALLARDEGKRRAEQYTEDAKGAGAASDVAYGEERKQDVKAAADKLLNSEPEALGVKPATHEKIKTCLAALKPVTDTDTPPDLATIQLALAKCGDDKVQDILNDLESQRQKTMATYNHCRDTLLATGKFDPTMIPSDPSRLLRDPDQSASAETRKQFEALKTQVQEISGSAKDCADNLGEAFDDLQNQENTAAAMAMIMNQVGAICMASGGNPYVCGGAFILAVLASLFSSGGGDGDGDGKSDGTGEQGDGSNMAGSGPRQTPPGNTPDGQTSGGGCDPAKEICTDTKNANGGGNIPLGDNCDPTKNTCYSCSVADTGPVMICKMADAKPVRLDASNLLDQDGAPVASSDELSDQQQPGLQLFLKSLQEGSGVKVAVCWKSPREVGAILLAEGATLRVATVKQTAMQFDEKSLKVPENGDLSTRCGG